MGGADAGREMGSQRWGGRERQTEALAGHLTCLGSTGHYLAGPCTKPCGNITCLPCPRGTFLARENHHETSCARCLACDEQGEGLPSAQWGQAWPGAF